jgi:hypothetical protein
MNLSEIFIRRLESRVGKDRKMGTSNLYGSLPCLGGQN